MKASHQKEGKDNWKLIVLLLSYYYCHDTDEKIKKKKEKVTCKEWLPKVFKIAKRRIPSKETM